MSSKASKRLQDDLRGITTLAKAESDLALILCVLQMGPAGTLTPENGLQGGCRG